MSMILRIPSGCLFLLVFQSSIFAQVNGDTTAPALPQLQSSTIAKNHNGTSGPGVEGQSPTLTLADAEARALKAQPRLLAARYRTQATDERVIQARSNYFPQVFGNLTGVEANGDSAVSAGALTTSSLSTRLAAGASLVQLITDFGRTTNELRSARSAAKAAGADEESVRQSVLMQVQQAYFAAEAAESVRKTAQAVLDFRRVTLRQLTALAQSQLRSTLDVQFAQVMVSEAELAMVRADSNVQKAQAQLAAAMGEESATSYTLADEPLPADPDADPASYLAEAIANRPDLESLRLRGDSAAHEALAQRDRSFPSVNALATGGEVPVHDSTIRHEYGAIGFNINIPVFTGGLYTSRAAEAKLAAKAAMQDVSLREVEIARDVRTTWADARDAYLQIEVSQRLVDQSNVAMRLAQAKYDAGLGSIVELNQAELNQTSALITAASARFDFMRAMTAFHFVLGDLH